MARMMITFVWEETPEMDYDGMIEVLMYQLGADDITDMPYVEPETEHKGGGPKPKKKDHLVD